MKEAPKNQFQFSDAAHFAMRNFPTPFRPREIALAARMQYRGPDREIAAFLGAVYNRKPV